ncbi:carbohydrate kinase family protein [Streptomyces sp. NPDC057638]|uniref:carbohydrate kinase family protein n=1 Tax=Streptomyces sp. NPDC057638 TaxID=3346190 RepID=UPI0036815241
MNKGALLVIGDVATDVVARYSTPLAHGTDTAARIRLLPGGAGANVACWAAQRGCHDVRLLARVGRADLRWHGDQLRASEVRPLLVPDDTAATATVIALVDSTAERTFLTDSGAAPRLSPDDWTPSLLDGVAHLHLSGYPLFAASGRRLARLALTAAHARGTTVSVDPASTGFLQVLGVNTLFSILDGVDVLVPNAHEARLLTGRSDPGDAAVALSRRFPLTVVTLGAQGVLVAESGSLTGSVPAPSVDAVDSTGAGDAFTGAFLAARLAGADPLTASTAGCTAGALAVTRVGGRPALPGQPGPMPPHAG